MYIVALVTEHFLFKGLSSSPHLTFVSSILSLHSPLLAKVAQSIIKATECQLETAMKTHIHIKHFSTFVKLLITHTKKKSLSFSLYASLFFCPFKMTVLILLRLLRGYHTTVHSLQESEPQRASLPYDKPFSLLMLTFHLRELFSLSGSCKAPLCLYCIYCVKVRH